MNITNYKQTLIDYGKEFMKVSLFYVMWIFFHYIAAHLYTRFCTPYGLYGFLISPFITMAPHCYSIRWVVDHGAIVINDMWVVLGAWACSFLFRK